MYAFTLNHSYCDLLRSGTSGGALLAAQSHFVNGGGFHDGLLLNIEDLTANKVERSGDTDVSDTSSLGMRLDVRQASGTMAQYLAGRPEQGSDFATDIAGYAEWAAFPGGDLSWDAGRAKYESDIMHRRWSNTSPYVSVVDEWFRIKVIYDFGAGNDGQIKIGTSINGTQYHQENVVGSGTYVEWFKATATTVYTTIQNADPTQPQTSYVDEISFKTVPGNHMVAAADDERGTYNIDGDGVPYITRDGVNDGDGADISWASLMRVYAAIKTTDQFAIMYRHNAGTYFGRIGNATSASSAGAGTPTNHVDGDALADQNQITLYNAVADGDPHYMEFRSVNFAGWSRLDVGDYGAPHSHGDAEGSFLTYPEAVLTARKHIDFINLFASQLKKTKALIYSEFTNELGLHRYDYTTDGDVITNIQWRIVIVSSGAELLISGSPGSSPSTLSDTRGTLTADHITGDTKEVVIAAGASDANLVGVGDLDIFMQTTDSFGSIIEVKLL